MKRRTLLLAGGAALAMPHVARSQASRVLKFIPQVDVPLLDPVITSAYITRNFGFTVFDTLFGLDGAFNPQPQMVDRFGAEDDGKRWTLVLRAACASTTARRCWRGTAPPPSRAGASGMPSARR